jgi:hypothetical protein
VEGDLAVQVRVGGEFQLVGERGFRVAGLIIEGGKDGCVSLQRNDWTLSWWICGRGSSTCIPWEGDHLDGPAYLLLERKGDRVRIASGRDGKTWTWVEPRVIKLPRKVKVGVVVEVEDEGTFKVVFDHFKLTPLSRLPR